MSVLKSVVASFYVGVVMPFLMPSSGRKAFRYPGNAVEGRCDEVRP